MATEFRAATPRGDASRRQPRLTAASRGVPWQYHFAASSPTQTDALVIDASMRQALVTTRALGRSGLRVGVAESPEVCDDPLFRVPAFASRWSTWSSTLPSYYG